MPHDSESSREAFRQLPPIDGISFWDKKCIELREKVATEPVDSFLRWPTIESTMFVGNAPYIDTEIRALTSEYIDAIQEPDIGGAIHYNSYTSGNLIHQAYHLSSWEMMTGQSVKDLQRIVEIGGGYGAMAMIVMRLGFQGNYWIIDLPEFSLLQQYYLSNALNDVERIFWSDQPADCDLFVACHSLSEMTLDERAQIADNVRANSYLFVYHCEHEGVDNLHYFAEFAESRSEYRWQRWVTEHLPDQVYMVGVKR